MSKHKRHNDFVMVDRGMLISDEFWKLSRSTQLIYLLIKRKYNGRNNGQIRLYYSELKRFFADATICKGFKELEKNHWIDRTKVGFGKYRWQYDIKLTGANDRTIKF